MLCLSNYRYNVAGTLRRYAPLPNIISFHFVQSLASQPLARTTYLHALTMPRAKESNAIRKLEAIHRASKPGWFVVVTEGAAGSRSDDCSRSGRGSAPACMHSQD